MRALARTNWSDLFVGLFDDTFPLLSYSNFSDNMDLVEGTDDYSLVANVPGMTKDDISLEIKDDMLTISCSKSAETSKGGDGKLIHKGRQSVSFKKSFYLSNIDLDKIEASVENGVLSIRLPKIPEKMARKIEIK